jgi:hypothetical protein
MSIQSFIACNFCRIGPKKFESLNIEKNHFAVTMGVALVNE